MKSVRPIKVDADHVAAPSLELVGNPDALPDEFIEALAGLLLEIEESHRRDEGQE